VARFTFGGDISQFIGATFSALTLSGTEDRAIKAALSATTFQFFTTATGGTVSTDYLLDPDNDGVFDSAAASIEVREDGYLPDFKGPDNISRLYFDPDPADATVARVHLDAWDATVGGAAPASETVAGIAELATTAEASAGTDTVRITTPAGVAAAINAHAALADPHPQYLLEDALGSALSAKADLVTGVVPLTQLPVGTGPTADTVVQRRSGGTAAVAPGVASDEAVTTAQLATSAPLNWKDYGVVADGTTDDTAAVNAAVAAAKAAGRTLHGTGTLRINSTVIIDCAADLSNATLNYYGSTVAVQVGTSVATAPTGTHRLTVALPRVVHAAKPTTGWTAGSVGVRLLNLNSSQVTVPHVQHFETGLQGYGQAYGTAYNNIYLGHLDFNKHNLSLSGDATGWCNQNTFYGGRFSHSSAEGYGLSGTRHIILKHLPLSQVNNNTWVNPSLESPNVVDVVVEIESGQYNLWINPRYEQMGPDPKLSIGTVALASNNVFWYGYASSTVAVTWGAFAGTGNAIFATTQTQRIVSGTRGDVIENAAAANPVLTVLAPGGTVANADPATAYTFRLSSQLLRMKLSTDANDRIRLNATDGRIYLGPGATAPVAFLLGGSTSVLVGGGSLNFLTDNSFDIGSAGSLRPRYVRAGTAVQVGTFATGSRPAAATAGAGAMVFDTTLNKPVWSTGSVWVDATGATV
jgi:hypothetical protein